MLALEPYIRIKGATTGEFCPKVNHIGFQTYWGLEFDASLGDISIEWFGIDFIEYQFDVTLFHLEIIEARALKCTVCGGCLGDVSLLIGDPITTVAIADALAITAVSANVPNCDDGFGGGECELYVWFYFCPNGNSNSCREAEKVPPSPPPAGSGSNTPTWDQSVIFQKATAGLFEWRLMENDNFGDDIHSNLFSFKWNDNNATDAVVTTKSTLSGGEVTMRWDKVKSITLGLFTDPYIVPQGETRYYEIVYPGSLSAFADVLQFYVYDPNGDPNLFVKSLINFESTQKLPKDVGSSDYSDIEPGPGVVNLYVPTISTTYIVGIKGYDTCTGTKIIIIPIRILDHKPNRRWGMTYNYPATLPISAMTRTDLKIATLGASPTWDGLLILTSSSSGQADVYFHFRAANEWESVATPTMRKTVFLPRESTTRPVSGETEISMYVIARGNAALSGLQLTAAVYYNAKPHVWTAAIVKSTLIYWIFDIPANVDFFVINRFSSNVAAADFAVGFSEPSDITSDFSYYVVNDLFNGYDVIPVPVSFFEAGGVRLNQGVVKAKRSNVGDDMNVWARVTPVLVLVPGHGWTGSTSSTLFFSVKLGPGTFDFLELRVTGDISAVTALYAHSSENLPSAQVHQWGGAGASEEGESKLISIESTVSTSIVYFAIEVSAEASLFVAANAGRLFNGAGSITLVNAATLDAQQEYFLKLLLTGSWSAGVYVTATGGDMEIFAEYSDNGVTPPLLSNRAGPTESLGITPSSTNANVSVRIYASEQGTLTIQLSPLIVPVTVETFFAGGSLEDGMLELHYQVTQSSHFRFADELTDSHSTLSSILRATNGGPIWNAFIANWLDAIVVVANVKSSLVAAVTRFNDVHFSIALPAFFWPSEVEANVISLR